MQQPINDDQNPTSPVEDQAPETSSEEAPWEAPAMENLPEEETPAEVPSDGVEIPVAGEDVINEGSEEDVESFTDTNEDL